MVSEQNRILYLNAFTSGSTGKIVRSLYDGCIKRGFDAAIVTMGSLNDERNSFDLYISWFYHTINRVLCRLDGSDGFHNKAATTKLLGFIEQFRPAIIHIHNVHGSFIHLQRLLSFCNKKNIRVVWTLHDCWPFTGGCAYFDYVECEKWKTDCKRCPSLRAYPSAFVDRRALYLRKKIALINASLHLITFVSPSLWLKEKIASSRIKSPNCLVINNGIPSPGPLTADEITRKKEELGILGKTALLFVSDGLSKRKGLDYFTKLATDRDLSDFAFITLGIKRGDEAAFLPPNIINVGYVTQKKEMDLLYSCADCLINPTVEDNFPTVNIEALANGTPVITFETGGSPEIIDQKTGLVVPKGDYCALKRAVLSLNNLSFSNEECRKRAALFTEEAMVKKYLALYDSLLKSEGNAS